jgi:hypothetical protein
MVKKLDGYDSILDKLNAHDTSLADKVSQTDIPGKIASMGYLNGHGYSYSVNTMSLTITSDLTVKNATFTNSSGITWTLDGSTQKTVIFENCIFDGVSFNIWGSNTYRFKNCTFINAKVGSIQVFGTSNKITFKDCEYLHERPVLADWNNNVNQLRFWSSAPIYIYGNNNECSVNRCTFDDNISVTTILVPSGTTGTKVSIKNNTFKNTFGGCITFNNPVSGIIENNTFENVGGIRGNESYYVADSNLGVGCNAIYALGCIDLHVINNIVANTVENGIEGTFHTVRSNTVKNAGYRYSEGYTTPSTECYYIIAKIIKDNVGINPYNMQAFVFNDIGSKFPTAIISGNNAITDTYFDKGAYLFNYTTACDCTVKENSHKNFRSKYQAATSSYSLDGYKFHFEGDNQFYSLIDSAFHKSKLISNYRTIYMPDSTSINVGNGTKTVIQESGIPTLQLTTADTFGRVYINGFNPYEGRACGIRLMIKATGNFTVSVTSQNADNSVPATDTFGVYGGQQYQYTGSGNYQEYTGIYPIYGKYTITVQGVAASQNIFIRYIEVTM